MTALHEEELEEALSHFNIPDKIVIKTWQEQHFQAIQHLSGTEGWSTPIRRLIKRKLLVKLALLD